MTQKRTPPDNTFQIRCRKLGHQIDFSYCRQENLGIPCAKSLDCWFSYFDVEQYLRQELSEDQWRQAFEQPPQSKLSSILDILEQVQQK